MIIKETQINYINIKRDEAIALRKNGGYIQLGIEFFKNNIHRFLNDFIFFEKSEEYELSIATHTIDIDKFHKRKNELIEKEYHYKSGVTNTNEVLKDALEYLFYKVFPIVFGDNDCPDLSKPSKKDVFTYDLKIWFKNKNKCCVHFSGDVIISDILKDILTFYYPFKINIEWVDWADWISDKEIKNNTEKNIAIKDNLFMLRYKTDKYDERHFVNSYFKNDGEIILVQYEKHYSITPDDKNTTFIQELLM